MIPFLTFNSVGSIKWIFVLFLIPNTMIITRKINCAYKNIFYIDNRFIILRAVHLNPVYSVKKIMLFMYTLYIHKKVL